MVETKNIEVISAMAIACASLITAIGLCIRRMHLKKVRMNSCCGNVAIDMRSNIPPSTVEEQKRTSFESISANTIQMIKAICGEDALKDIKKKAPHVTVAVAPSTPKIVSNVV